MAFIDKKNPVVLNVKLTSKGRELLSKGQLTFNYFSIGDSEIDYAFNNTANFNPFYSHILRPADKNPSLLSFITKELSGDTFNVISNVPSTPTIIQNTAPPLGFFSISTGSTSFITDSDHIKQPDAMIIISGITGGTRLVINKAPTYLANVNEPSVNDYILIKWTNPLSISTTGYTVNKSYPTPYLIYKIHEIITGTLATDNLVVRVDRNLPDFSNITGGSNNVVAGALIYYNYENFTGNTIYSDFSTDYVSDAVIAFLQNCQCPTLTFPFWNMSIIFTDEIAGIQSTDRAYDDFKSRTYAGFVSYIQNQAPILKKLGVIHYTNSSPSNTYAEELYKNTPILYLPTIMWHKNTTTELGLELRAHGSVKMLTGATKSLNTSYYDLADLQGNIVGKIFNDLKLFVIEDQELLFAMSYKSNRSWTLPNYTVGINDNVVIGCIVSEIDFQLSATSITTIGGSDGKLYVYDIINYVGQMILQISGNTHGLVYLNYITGNTLLTNLSADTYNVKIIDTAAINTPTGKTITISSLDTESNYALSLYGGVITANGLNPNFSYTQISPVQLRIFKSDIGTVYGTGATTPAFGYKTYGASDATIVWTPFGAYTYLDIYGFTYTGLYTLVIKDYVDYLGSPFTYYVYKDYVAVGSPFLTASSIVALQGSDENGTYVTITTYLAAINDNYNRIVGDIEFAIYPYNTGYLFEGIPPIWETLDSGAILGSAKKLYVSQTGAHSIVIREAVTAPDGIKITAASVTKTITIT